MVPADKVVTCKQTDTIKTVMDLLLEHQIGAVVVPNAPDHPVGIITKTDIVQAYHDNVALDHKAQEIMQTGLETCDENMNRDQAARILERNKVGGTYGKKIMMMSIENYDDVNREVKNV